MSDKALFDENGRCIPEGLSAPAHARTRRRFICLQPEIDYPAIHARLSKYLDADGAISVADFQARAEAIIAGLKADPAVANVAKAVTVPFFLPKIADVNGRDMGKLVQDTYVKAVEKAFTDTYPNYAFYTHHTESLAGVLNVQPGSRHQVLLDAVAKDVVVGVFLVAFQEFSVPASIEATAKLPEQFLLAGGIDTCAAFIACPGLLERADGYPPLMFFGALTGETPTVAYHLEAYGYNLTFNRRVHFGHAAEYWANGLVVLG